MATVKDVARVAGVSLGTVSNVLNGKVSVKQETKEKVYDAMKTLNFQYNMNASALRTKTTKNIGLIIPTIVNPYYPELARGVEDVLNHENFTLFLCNSDRNVEKEQQYVDALLSKGTDGLILVKSRLSEVALQQIATRTALVLVDHDGGKTDLYSQVNVDDVSGIIQGMNLLRQYGHKKIAFISGLQDAYSSICRIKTFHDCFSKWGETCPPEYIVEGNFSWNSGYMAAENLLALPNPPTAIFAANDIMAMGAIRAICDKGFHVPEDISVLGYDDIEFCNLSVPPLTTIHQPKYQVGAEAARLMFKMLNKQEAFEKSIVMQTRIVIRTSVGNA